jgi:hypothetical protein
LPGSPSLRPTSRGEGAWATPPKVRPHSNARDGNRGGQTVSAGDKRHREGVATECHGPRSGGGLRCSVATARDEANELPLGRHGPAGGTGKAILAFQAIEFAELADYSLQFHPLVTAKRWRDGASAVSNFVTATSWTTLAEHGALEVW